MNWPPNKAWTSSTERKGFRHFIAINYGGKGGDRWVNLASVLDGNARLRVSWNEMKVSTLWSSGWQQLPKVDSNQPESALNNLEVEQEGSCLHPSEDFDSRPWY